MKYQVFCGTYELWDGTAYRSYGVCWPGGSVEDLTLSEAAANAFAQLLNEGGVEARHVPGLADDFLAGAWLQTADGMIK